MGLFLLIFFKIYSTYYIFYYNYHNIVNNNYIIIIFCGFLMFFLPGACQSKAQKRISSDKSSVISGTP